MNKQKPDVIQSYLQREEVRQRISQLMRKLRTRLTVPISSAATFFGFSENQLRDWEEHGLLKPERPGGTRGRRQYSMQELAKLALISELMRANFAPSDIPPDIDKLWQAISSSSEDFITLSEQQSWEKTIALTINQRIEDARKHLFWSYFVSHALHLSLMLICEDVPNTGAGLVLPLEAEADVSSIRRVEDLAQLGEVLVGWLGPSHSSQTLLMPALSFEYAIDYRLLPLTVMKDDQPEEAPADNTLIFMQRRSRRLTLSVSMVETIRRLLRPICEDVNLSRSCFGAGMRDVLIPSTDLHSNHRDIILNGLADMTVHLGGRTAEGTPRWRFCCILLPQDSILPLHQRSLVVQAQSKEAPYRLGKTMITPDNYAYSPGIRALQSGHIIYLPEIAQTDTSIAFREQEEPIRSAVAIPIGGEDGLAVAVLYVASTEAVAFSESDLRVLRMICRMAEEALKTYAIRQRAMQKLTDVIEMPALVDPFFRDFLSENDFIRDVETLLSEIQAAIPDEVVMDHHQGPVDEIIDIQIRQMAGRCVSFIGVDLDKQSSLANKYGDRAARNLAREAGLRIQEQLRVTFREYTHCQLYYIFADRFSIMLRDITLERARYIAEQLRQALAGTYKLDALRVSIDQPQRPESLLELSDITARLGVTSYSYRKLKEILLQHPPVGAESEVRAIISSALAVSLDIGRNAGGNIVVSWDEKAHDLVPITHHAPV